MSIQVTNSFLLLFNYTLFLILPATFTFLQADTQTSYNPDAQTISIYHVSRPQPASEYLKDCTKPHFAFNPQMTLYISTSPSLGKTLNSSIIVMRMTLNSLGAIWEMISSVAEICSTAVDFPCWSYLTFCVAGLRAGPVGCNSYNMYFLFQSSLIAVI